MSKRYGARPVVFVCAAISSTGELITKTIPAVNQEAASIMFKEYFLVDPQKIIGPFFKKRAQVIENTRELKFANETKQAVYNDWLVNAFILKEPANQAYLVFIKRTDDKKVPAPKGTITVPISELRFL